MFESHDVVGGKVGEQFGRLSFSRQRDFDVPRGVYRLRAMVTPSFSA